MRRTLSQLSVIVGLTLLSTLINAEPAQAYSLAGHRWKTGTVCVIDRTGDGPAWPVSSATTRWSGVPDLTYRYGGDCEQRVYVYARSYGATGWHGTADAWRWSNHYSGEWEWLSGDAYRVYRCDIRMNDSYYLSWADKRSAIMHELGHCSGLDHTGSYALMNIYRFHRYDYPTSDDKAGIERRYPW